MIDRAVLDGIPEAVAERVRPVGQRPVTGGDFVLYWMRTGVRGHENPALDAAIHAANQVGRPVFVYHALSERYPFASDRHHRFILEGARDVDAELARRGIGYAFHLERPGHRGLHLQTLARQAALVVTEDFPCEPIRGWTERLSDALTATPVWCVDTACVMPMRLTGRAFDRAFEYREATAAARAERLPRSWNEVDPLAPPFIPRLPFEPLDLQAADLDALVACCEIDHGVGPVLHSRGGSVAGYARWDEFRTRRLAAYARDRNDPLRDGVSRMSAYLHYGHVSPLRIAREAMAQETAGARKYLDELLIWRELAYTWCFYRREHESLAALPRWAARTLEEHGRDRRQAEYSWERLARGETGDPLWDAAQRTLVVRGELHNNLRMTWGKAVLQWTASPEKALAMLVDLNHRFALDGRDPASYGGLLWCLGLFDRPFRPPQPVLGSVRPRPTREHAKRLDVGAYARRFSRLAESDALRIVVVGGGIAGSICARTLRDHGHDVTLLDKGRGPGGRMSTRRTATGRFDHGAQYFTARDERFLRFLNSWRSDGVVGTWQPRLVRVDEQGVHPDELEETRFVGTPGMNEIVRHLHTALTVRYGAHVIAVEREGDRWLVRAEDRHQLEAHVVVVAVPAPQAVPLLSAAPAMATRLSQVEVDPCWAVLLSLEEPLAVPFDAARVTQGPLSWAARDGSKPGRGPEETWVLHASPEWSREHLEDDARGVARGLRDALARVADAELPPVRTVDAHRWRYARVRQPVGDDALWDGERGIGACGDGCRGARVEDAFLSGHAMAGHVLRWVAGRARGHEPSGAQRRGPQLEMF